MSTKHTPEPWGIENDDEDPFPAIFVSTEHLEMHFPPAGCTFEPKMRSTFRIHASFNAQFGKDLNLANASRATACVNALAGLEPSAIAGVVKAFEAFHAAALKSGLEFDEDVATEWWAIEDALAALKGEG